MDSKLLKICLAACISLSAAACEETKNGGLDCDSSWVPECLSETSYVACNNGRLEGVDCAALGQGKCVADATVGAKCDGAVVNNCGNGAIDAGEECDGSNLNNKSCADYKGAGATGSLSCSSDCKIVSSACQSAVVSCNNDGVKGDGEECDGSDFGAKSCEDYQGAGATGSLSCNNCAIDSSACTAAVDPCGNGSIDTNEECDGSNLNGLTCSDVLGRSANGDLSCDSDCKLVDSACTPLVIDTCNNDGIKDNEEECDGADFGGKSCADFAGAGASGVLACDACVIDYSDCEEADPCGNGRLDDGEDCDGSNLNGKSCADVLGEGATGDLSCSAVCLFDISDCEGAIIDTCNNDGVKNGDEECDGSDFGSKSCVDYKGEGATGDLSCRGCVIDSSACRAAVSADCGNGAIDSGEECDGSNLNNKSCVDYKGEGATGSLSCSDSCTIVSTDCKAAVVNDCGNGAIDPGEECDGDLPIVGKSCVDYKGAGATGELSCNASCKIDSSACKAAGVDPCGDGVYDEGEDCSCENLVDDVCTSDGKVAYCATGNKTHIIACDSGCTLLDASDIVEEEYWSAECKHPGFDEKCTAAGDLIDGYCFVEEYEGEEYALGVQYYCAKDKNGNLGTIDLLNFDEYEECDDGCNDSNTACKASATCGDGVYDLGEACECENLTSDICLPNGNGAFCSQGEIAIVECSNGCALVDFSAMLGSEYWSAECKRPAIDAQCSAAGDEIPFCAVEGSLSYSSNYYCGPTEDGGLATVDLSMWGSYQACEGACNAEGTACEGTISDGNSCVDDATLKMCQDGSCRDYNCENAYLEGTVCHDLGGSYGAYCYLPCTSQNTICVEDSYYGHASVAGTCVDGYLANATVTACAGGCASDGTCEKVSDMEGTACDPSSDTYSCASDNNKVIMKCDNNTSTWKANRCSEDGSLECANITEDGPDCYEPCTNPGATENVCEPYWFWDALFTNTCTATANGNYMVSEMVDFCDDGCNEAGDGCKQLSEKAGTPCDPTTDKYECDGSEVILVCDEDSSKWAAYECASAVGSGTVCDDIGDGNGAWCYTTCDTVNEHEIFCSEDEGDYFSMDYVCKAYGSVKYWTYASETFCEDGFCNNLTGECSDHAVYTACNDYPGGCQLSDGRNCADACDSGELCAVDGTKVKCGASCRSGDPDTYICEYYIGTQWEGDVDAYPATCSELSDGTWMYVTGSYIECGKVANGATCTEGTGCD